MLKELKYFLFLFVIILFFFLSLKYYFSDSNKRNYYRSLKLIDEKINEYLDLKNIAKKYQKHKIVHNPWSQDPWRSKNMTKLCIKFLDAFFL